VVLGKDWHKTWFVVRRVRLYLQPTTHSLTLALGSCSVKCETCNKKLEPGSLSDRDGKVPARLLTYLHRDTRISDGPPLESNRAQSRFIDLLQDLLRPGGRHQGLRLRWHARVVQVLRPRRVAVDRRRRGARGRSPASWLQGLLELRRRRGVGLVLRELRQRLGRLLRRASSDPKTRIYRRWLLAILM